MQILKLQMNINIGPVSIKLTDNIICWQLKLQFEDFINLFLKKYIFYV